MKEHYKGTPFTNRLVEGEFTPRSSRLMSLVDLPNKAIRVDTRDTELYRIIMGRQLFRKYKAQGICVPEYEIVLGSLYDNKEVERKTAFYVIDKVYEQGKLTPQERKDFKSQFDQYYTTLISIMSDVFFHGGFYITDLKQDHLVYGKTARNQKNRLYYVDVDPFFNSFDPLVRSHQNAHFVTHLRGIGYQIREAELYMEACMGGGKLSSSRKTLTKFLRSVPKTHPYYEEIAKLM